MACAVSSPQIDAIQSSISSADEACSGSSSPRELRAVHLILLRQGRRLAFDRFLVLGQGGLKLPLGKLDE